MRADAPTNEPSQPAALDVAEALDATVAALKAGGVVVLPTDTVYGLAAGAGQPSAIERIYQLKQRPADVAIALLVADVDQAAMIADLTSAERSAAARLWPGALTLVLQRAPATDTRLGRQDGTVGVRAPASEFVRAVAREVGPLATTSANLSGTPTAPTAGQAAASLAGLVDLVVDAGPSEGMASTVARVHLDGEVAIYRQGDVTLEQIRFAAGQEKSG